MITDGLPQRVSVRGIVRVSSDAPPQFAEYAYYALVFYAIMGTGLGVSIEMVGAGMRVVLAAFCVLRLGLRAMTIYAPLALLLGCAVSYLLVQLALHGESLSGEYVRVFITWILEVITVQSLSLRKGFMRRFALAVLLIGLATLPYLRVHGEPSIGSDVQQMGLQQGIGLSNPNALGTWFGFCFVYFAILGIEAKRDGVRVASWLVAVGCLYVVGLTVSRGTLFAAAIALTVALRRLLKRGFVPVVVLISLCWIAYGSGLFERSATFYAARGMEETGRYAVWPLAIERFLSSPLVGVGASKSTTYVPSHDITIPPHNSFIYFALASGVVPLAFFVAYWIRAARGAFSYPEWMDGGPFRIPLFIFAFLIALIGDLVFTWPWMIMIMTLSATMPTRASRQTHRIVPRIMRGERAHRPEYWGERKHTMGSYHRRRPPLRS